MHSYGVKSIAALCLTICAGCGDPGAAADTPVGVCSIPSRTSAPNDSRCEPPDIGDTSVPNPGPASTFVACCEGGDCTPAICSNGEICDRSIDGTHVSDTGVGVCRRPCRLRGAAYTCYGGCSHLPETSVDCADGESCELFMFRYFTYEQPLFAYLGLCVAEASE